MLFPRFARENLIVRRAGRTLEATSSVNPTIEKMMRAIRVAYCNRAGWATMIRGASPRRVTGMVQKTSIASRSFQPGAKTTNIFLSAVGSTRIQGTAPVT
jgi:hypothetical protein